MNPREVLALRMAVLIELYMPGVRQAEFERLPSLVAQAWLEGAACGRYEPAWTDAVLAACADPAVDDEFHAKRLRERYPLDGVPA